MIKQNQKPPPAHNGLFIAAAGTGKTSMIVDGAQDASCYESILLTTYTLENLDAILAKLSPEVGVAKNLEVITWWSFLLKHGVRPYQSALDAGLDGRAIGFCLVNGESGKKYPKGNYKYSEQHKDDRGILRHYFNRNMAICSDKIAKFVCKNNEKTKGLVVGRISDMYDRVYIDEAQDLAGYDLEVIKLLAASTTKIYLVGDPRQTVYQTHNSSKYKKYRDGKLPGFIEDECRGLGFEVDDTTFNRTHRHGKQIAQFASSIFPEHEQVKACDDSGCRDRQDDNHSGVFVVLPDDRADYERRYGDDDFRVLRWSKSQSGKSETNFGQAKGREYRRVLIEPTGDMKKFLSTGSVDHIKSPETRAKFYVAVTRAVVSVAIIYDYNKSDLHGSLVRKWSM